MFYRQPLQVVSRDSVHRMIFVQFDNCTSGAKHLMLFYPKVGSPKFFGHLFLNSHYFFRRQKLKTHKFIIIKNSDCSFST